MVRGDATWRVEGRGTALRGKERVTEGDLLDFDFSLVLVATAQPSHEIQAQMDHGGKPGWTGL